MRNPNGYGSVYKLSGNRRNPWTARITVGWTFDEEKKKSNPKYKYIGYYPNKKEAMIALSDYNKNPYDLDFNKITFKEVYDKWSNIHFDKISHSNITGYKAAFRLCKEIEDMKFINIKLEHLQYVIDKSGKNTPTLRKLKVLFGMLYDYAIIHELVTADKRELVRYLDISKNGNPNAYNRTAFKTKEIEKLWKLIDSNKYISVILILIYTGLRIGELLSLKKENINLEERWIYIEKSKTDAGIRYVPIAEKVVSFIEYWMSRDCEYLICTETNKPFKYRNFYDSYWKILMNELGFKHHPHSTRHTCISMLKSVGVDDVIIRKIVGHKGQGVTETVYTHLEMPYKLEAINKI